MNPLTFLWGRVRGDVPRSASYGVYISQLIRFAGASSYVTDFSTRSELLTQKLLKQGYQYHKLRKTFSKFYRRYYGLVSEFQVGLESLLRQGLSGPGFCGDLVYKFKKRLLALVVFQRCSLKWFPAIEGLAVALVCCGGLRA